MGGRKERERRLCGMEIYLLASLTDREMVNGLFPGQLHPIFVSSVTEINFCKYADDTYLIIPAANVNTRSNELQHISDWAASNNLSLNLSKSEEIVFVDKRKKHKFNIPDTLDGLKRVQNIKSLGVTFTNGLSVTHVQHLTTSNAQILYALKILRAHGLCRMAIQGFYVL